MDDGTDFSALSLGEQNGIPKAENGSASPHDAPDVVTTKSTSKRIGYATDAAGAGANVMAPRIVDLRSDTLTLPTPAMRTAMAQAAVGDDAYGSDPTANALQEEVAKLFGKEAGLFVPSGTMGNLIAVLVHCEVRGSEVILGSESHIRHYEQGSIATVGGVFSNVVMNKSDGTMDLHDIEAAIAPDDEHCAITRLICLENSHNRCGGRCISAEYTDKVGAIAKRHGLKLHVDGARIFNAATALGVSVERLVQSADSVSICLSKGLAAPVGSILVGSKEFIAKARRQRKALGGSMRQVGVLCAAGFISIRTMSTRLNEDHENAQDIAEGLNHIPGLRVDVSAVETNMVKVEITSKAITDTQEFCETLKGLGVLALSLDNGWIRLVTSYHVTKEDVPLVISCFQKLLSRPAV